MKTNVLDDKNNKHKLSGGILWAILAIYSILQLYPLVWLVLFSFKNNAEIFSGNVMGLPSVWRWENYVRALLRDNALDYFKNSIIVTAASILITVFLSVMAAYAIARMKWKLNKFVLLIFLSGLMIPIHSALLPVFILLRTTNLLSTYWSLIIPYTAFGLSMAIFILVGFFESLPKELEESACIDGAGIFNIFFKIILPLVKPAVATVSIFTFLSCWNELMFATTFISKQEYKTITVGIMSLAGQYVTEWGPIGAALVVATIPTIIIYMLMSNQVQDALVKGAVKG